MPVADYDEKTDPMNPKNLFKDFLKQGPTKPDNAVETSKTITQAAPKKEEPSGATTTGNRPDPVEPATKPVVVNPTPVQAGTADNGGTSTGTTESGASPRPTETGTSKVEDEDDYLKAEPPKDKANWDKWTGRRLKKETALKKDITDREARIADLEKKLTEFESKSTSAEPDPRIKAEIDRLQSENKELTDRITALNVTEHPKFKAYFQTKIDDAIAEAKSIVGKDKEEQIERILKMPDNEFRKAQLDEFLTELDNDGDRMDVRGVVRDLRKVDKERDQEIRRANEHKGKLEADTQAQAQASRAQREQVFNETLKAMTDPEKGFAPFQVKDGDDAWNKIVKDRVEAAKGLLFSNDLKPEYIAKAAFNAVALPAILKAYQTDSANWSHERSKFEAQIAELSAAQPKTGTASDTKTGSEQPVINKDSNPYNVVREWAKGTARSMRELNTQ